MESLIKDSLKTQLFKPFGSGGGGCINEGHGYNTDHGKVFVKWNSKPGARLMFTGENASLNAILATGAIKVPKPLHVLDNPKGGAVLVMEYLDMDSLSSASAKLGDQLAKMHLHNTKLGAKENKNASSVHGNDSGPKYVNQFGFDVSTCCGYIPQVNSWKDDWVTFYAQNKLQVQMDLVEEKGGDREARELWSKLQRKIPKMFEGIDIKPALLHGDLWGGNVAQEGGEPVIFDPASFYGHSEFELGISGMFGGFSGAFFDAYHALIPKAKGFEQRRSLYELFHYLNHWNHFGGGYRNQSLSIMRRLAKD